MEKLKTEERYPITRTGASPPVSGLRSFQRDQVLFAAGRLGSWKWLDPKLPSTGIQTCLDLVDTLTRRPDVFVDWFCRFLETSGEGS